MPRAARNERLSEMESVAAFAYFAKSRSLSPSATKQCGAVLKSLLMSFPHSSPTACLPSWGPGQRVVAACRPRDRVVEVAHRGLGVTVAERRVGILGILLVLLCAHLLPFG